MFKQALVFALAAAVLSLGCDRSKPQAKNISTTSMRDGPTTSPTTLPTTLPAHSVLTINGEEKLFPPARLVLQQSDPNIDLLLFSDDPQDALAMRYKGNRYYLPLSLRIADLADLPMTVLRLQAPSIERRDIPDGIFLEGNTRQLQPYDVQVEFIVKDKTVSVVIQGEFLMFDLRRELMVPERAFVHGVLMAELEKGQK